MALSPLTSRTSEGGLFDAYALIRDEKAANTAGGGFTSGAWRTRDLNTEAFDPDDIVQIAANQFALQAGTYFVMARCPALRCGAHKCKLANITDATDTIIGASVQADAGASGSGTDAYVAGRFTIAAAKTFELQHRCTTTRNTDGLGLASNFGVIEVYAEVQIWREG